MNKGEQSWRLLYVMHICGCSMSITWRMPTTAESNREKSRLPAPCWYPCACAYEKWKALPLPWPDDSVYYMSKPLDSKSKKNLSEKRVVGSDRGAGSWNLYCLGYLLRTAVRSLWRIMGSSERRHTMSGPLLSTAEAISAHRNRRTAVGSTGLSRRSMAHMRHIDGTRRLGTVHTVAWLLWLVVNNDGADSISQEHTRSFLVVYCFYFLSIRIHSDKPERRPTMKFFPKAQSTVATQSRAWPVNVNENKFRHDLVMRNSVTTFAAAFDAVVPKNNNNKKKKKKKKKKKNMRFGRTKIIFCFQSPTDPFSWENRIFFCPVVVLGMLLTDHWLVHVCPRLSSYLPATLPHDKSIQSTIDIT